MSPRLSVSVDLSFPVVPPGHFLGCDVALPGARMGDVVLIVEPSSRPPGLSVFAFVRSPGWVGVCCKNKTGEYPISASTGTYKLTILNQ